MRFLGLSSSIIGLSIIVAGCTTSSPDMTKAKLLSNVKAKMDPNSIIREAKTKVIVCQVKQNDDAAKAKSAKLFIKVKYPNKFKRMLLIPNKGVFIEAYNGKIGWTYSTRDGIKRQSGAALDELKLQTALAVNRGNLKAVYKTIKFKGEATIAGKHCYKIIGQPKEIYKSQPITLFINKSTLLPQAKEEIFDGANKKFPIITIWSNYKNKNGALIPMHRTVDINGTLLDITVLSVKWNTYVDDSEFEPPVKLK